MLGTTPTMLGTTPTILGTAPTMLSGTSALARRWSDTSSWDCSWNWARCRPSSPSASVCLQLSSSCRCVATWHGGRGP